jgi:hypothetical protein
MANTSGVIQVEDYDGEKSSVHFNLQDIDLGELNYGSVAQDLDELKDSVLTVTRGVVRHAALTVKYNESGAAVTDVEAAREGKWLVTYRDTTQYLDSLNVIENPGFNNLYKVEIPCADRTLLEANSDEADLTEAVVWAPFVTSLEANLRSPTNRSAQFGVTPTNKIVSIKYVGRNN